MQAILQLFRFANSACGTKTGFLPSIYDGLACSSSNTPEISAVQDVAIIIGNIVRILIAVSGALAVILLLVASVYYITAMADPSRTKRAKEIIINTMTGLVLIVLSYAIVTYITGNF